METHIINRKGYDLKKGVPTTIHLPNVIYALKSYCQFETSEFGLNARIKVVASGYDSDIPEHLRHKEENRHSFTYSRIIDDKIIIHPLYAQEVSNAELIDTFDRIELTSDRDIHIAFSIIDDERIVR